MFNLTKNVSLVVKNQSIHEQPRIYSSEIKYKDLILLIVPFWILANIFTFYVLTKLRPQTSNTCILRVLSFVDTMVLFMYSTNALQCHFGVGKFFYWLTVVFSQIMQNCSSYVLVVLSLDRCILICYPLHARKWCTIRNARRTLGAMIVIPPMYTSLYIVDSMDL